MPEQTPRTLPLLERLALYVPGYGGYLDRGNRRAADRVLREAIADRLTSARSKLEEAMRQCVDRGALGEVAPLDRTARHLDGVAQRLRAAGSGTDDFYTKAALDSAKADSLHAADLALFERADALARHFDAPDGGPDRLARFDADLKDFEAKLDDRALRLRGIR